MAAKWSQEHLADNIECERRNDTSLRELWKREKEVEWDWRPGCRESWGWKEDNGPLATLLMSDSST